MTRHFGVVVLALTSLAAQAQRNIDVCHPYCGPSNQERMQLAQAGQQQERRDQNAQQWQQLQRLQQEMNRLNQDSGGGTPAVSTGLGSCPETVRARGATYELGAHIRRAGGVEGALRELRQAQQQMAVQGDCSRFGNAEECRATRAVTDAAVNAAQHCALMEAQRRTQGVAGASTTTPSISTGPGFIGLSESSPGLRSDAQTLREGLRSMNVNETVASAAQALDSLPRVRKFHVHNSCAYSIQMAWCASPGCTPSDLVTIPSGGDTAPQPVEREDSLRLGRACQLQSGPSKVFWDRETDQCWTTALGSGSRTNIPGQGGCISIRWSD
jgi:hypothetical protein